MNDHNRSIDERDDERGSSTESPQAAQAPDDELGMRATTSRNRSHRDPAETADDRGLARERRSFSGEREHDELGSEMEDGGEIDRDTFDDEPGGSRQSDR